MTPLLHLPADDATNFGRRPFQVSHELTGHPLVETDALAQLADSLPPDMVEHNSGDVDAIVSSGAVPRANLSPGEIVRSIETNNCWIVLPIHTAPAYRELYDALFDEVRAYLPSAQGDIMERQGVFFLATGGSTTPAHIDLEHGLLLHLRGRKEVHVGDFPDPASAQLKSERMLFGEHRNVSQPPQGGRHFTLEPGDGVHIPAFSPHVIHTEPGQISLSLTIALRTEALLRDSAVHRANHHLRRVGLKPGAPGRNRRSDRIKSTLVEAVGTAKRRRAT